MDKIDLKELERMARAATPGPWEMVDARAFLDDEDFEIRNGHHCIGYGTSEADAQYIAEACNAVPELIAENRALRERVRELERQRDWLANKLACMCSVSHVGSCGVPEPCPYRKGSCRCLDTEKEDWIQAAKEAGG